MSTIIVFAPHPDDEIIGCGGRIRQHVACKDKVIVIFITSGESGDLKLQGSQLSEIRQNEARSASAIIGYSDLEWLGLPDGGISYSSEHVQTLTDILRTHQPNIVYCPHQQDAHPDHRSTHQLVAEAINRASGNSFPSNNLQPWRVKTWLTYEVWTPLTKPQLSVNIDMEIEIKLEALKAYHSQLANVAYDEAIAGLNRYRGAMTGLGKFVECYGVERTESLVSSGATF